MLDGLARAACPGPCTLQELEAKAGRAEHRGRDQPGSQESQGRWLNTPWVWRRGGWGRARKLRSHAASVRVQGSLCSDPASVFLKWAPWHPSQQPLKV